MTTKQEDLIKERIQLQETVTNEKDIKRRLRDFKKTLEQNEVLNEFDRYVFESIVEKVIVGGYDEDGNIDPAQLVFVYKTGFKNSLDGNRFKPERKNARANRKSKNLYSHTNDENQSLCSDTKGDTRGDGSIDNKKINIKVCKALINKGFPRFEYHHKIYFYVSLILESLFLFCREIF